MAWNSANIRQHLTVFPSDIKNIYLKYYRILQNLMRSYEILWKLTKLMKAMIFHSIFFVKSLCFIPFHSIAMHYWHFVILYGDKQNFSVCCCTVSPLGDISKYFAIVKWKAICQILQILTQGSQVKNSPCHHQWHFHNKLRKCKYCLRFHEVIFWTRANH
jgi:hypothetical protein